MVHRYHSGGGNLPPALTLLGSRGTGKTTTARILAAALNCEAPDKGEPCCSCQSCMAIATGRAPGVDELDMASHGSVDDIRQLKQSAAFGFSGNYRVFLLDEVHAASAAAFDALLKLLEEPPPNTLFLLLTTEHDQIPETILSRAMSLEFRRITTDDIAARLAAVAAERGIADRITDPAVYRLLAVRARGGLRDAIMSLEQAHYHEGPITVELVREVFGVSDLPQRLLDAAVKGDLSRGLTALNEALASAFPAVPLVDGLLDGLVSLVAAHSGAAVADGSVSAQWAQAVAPGIPTPNLLGAMDACWELRSRVRNGDPSAPSAVVVGYTMLLRALSPRIQVAPAQHPTPTGQARDSGSEAPSQSSQPAPSPTPATVAQVAALLSS